MKSTQSFSKSKMLSLPFVLGLLLSTASASPIPYDGRLIKRDAASNACPGTLRGPSGQAYFAFSSNLSNKVAQEACRSCHGGVLANVGATDLQFLAQNLEQTSWIKAWNGDDYGGSCMTIQPAGGTAGVNVDPTCASRNWPLCQAAAAAAGPDGTVRIEGEVTNGETINNLAIPYIGAPEEEASADNIIVQAPEAVNPIPQDDDTVTAPAPEVASSSEVPAPGAAADASSEQTFFDAPDSEAEEPAADVWGPSAEVETPSPDAVVSEAETPAADAAPATPEAETPAADAAPATPEAQTPAADASPATPEAQTPAADAAPATPEAQAPAADAAPATPEAQAPAADAASAAPEAAAPAADASTPAAPETETTPAVTEPEASSAVAESPSAGSTPVAAVVEEASPASASSSSEEEGLAIDKERVRAAFEEDKEACSALLAYGEQDPIAREYSIEHMRETVRCEEARHAALVAAAQARAAKEQAKAESQQQEQVVV
ncbi:hypothetical protein BGZ94_006700 [Podila epigama]|nr:hypothetical protein BGZ94_006700 [Podila epigama]